MKPSSSPPSTASSDAPPAGALFGPMFSAAVVDRETDDRAWLQAMLDVERALAVAQARAGLVPVEAATEIAAHCNIDGYDVDEIGRRAAASASPVIPVVRDLAAAVAPDARPWVHFGATSQDVLDTAASLVAGRAVVAILADLAGAAQACAELAGAHRDTLMIGRTMLQHAIPTTFGLKCAGWLVAVDEARTTLAAVRDRRLAVQFGGPTGTLASLGDHGVEVLHLLAEELGLAEPVLPWHTNRVRVAELAAALGTVAGVLGKIALDVVLLAQTEVGEVSEGPGGPGEDRGGSSAMPHKHNPVQALLISANARRVPGLVATLLAAMPQEQERAAGAWQAEWETLTVLLRLVGGAAARGHELVSGLRVDPDRMRRNLEGTDGLAMAGAVAERLAPALGRTAAQDLIREACAQADGRPLRDALREVPEVRAHLSEVDIDAALDPAGYLGSAGEFVDRALASHAATRRELREEP